MKSANPVKLHSGNDVASLPLRRSELVAAVVHCVFAVLVCSAAYAAPKESSKSAELFGVTNVYIAHFHFTAEQWKAMEPETEGSFGGGGPGGRPGMRPGGPGRFGPGMFLAPTLMGAGDANRDSKLTKAEFEALGERWFTAFDTNKSGVLKGDQLRDGLNATLGGMGAGGPPRMNLQGTEGKRNGLATMLGVEFDYVKADLEFDGKRLTNVAVRYKGNGTWMQSQGSLKRSMKVDLNEFVKGQKIRGISKLNFHNSVTDGSWMNEVLSHRFYRDAGVAAPRTAYARVYVTVPGKHDKQYLGLYSLVENIDDNFTEDRFGTKKGAIFKPVTPELFADLGDDWAKYKQTYDPKDDPAPADTQRVIDFCKLVTHASDEEFAAKMPEFLDVEQFARYMAGTVWLATLDSILGIGQNYYVHLNPKSRKFEFIPWDLDHSFGQFFLMGNQEQRNELSIHKPWRGQNRFLERVYRVEAFKKLYLARLKEINETNGRPERITKQVDEIAGYIRPAVKEESEEKLARFDKAVAGENVEPAGFPGGGGGGRGGPPGGPFTQGVQPIKKFVAVRGKSVADQLAGKSEGADLDTPPPGMPRNMGPGMFIGPAIQAKFDLDRNGELTRAEFTGGFEKWFASWDSEKSGALTEEKLREALNQEFAPPGGFPGPGGQNGPGGGGPSPGRPPQ